MPSQLTWISSPCTARLAAIIHAAAGTNLTTGTNSGGRSPLLGQILQDGFARNSVTNIACDIRPENLAILLNDKHGGRCLSSLGGSKKFKHTVLFGNGMFGIGQDRILGFGYLSTVRGILLGLNGKGYDLRPFFFKCGTIILQLNELVQTKVSGVDVVEEQDDCPMIFQFVGQADHVSVYVGQGKVRGGISNTRTTGGCNCSYGRLFFWCVTGGCNCSYGRFFSWCVTATRNQE